MSYSLRQVFFLIVIISLSSLSPLPATADDWQWNTEARVIAVSDIHGAIDEFVTLLKGVQLIDEAGHWTGTADHLVIVGDVLDRGAASRDVLALIMGLESEAEQSGGRVHLILGNHEIMNLVGDLRYVTVEEYARYTDVEDPADRSAGLRKFRNLAQNKELGEAAVLERFKQNHPPGFFGHSKLFSAEGALGKWLLTRPAIIKINDSVFVHGGLSQSMLGKSLAEINHLHHKVLRDYVSSREYFVSKGILEAATNFFDQPHLIEQTLTAEGAKEAMSQEDQEAGKHLFDAYHSDIFADDSPTWYRGNIGCSTAIEQDRLRMLLQGLGARRLVIGHSPTPSRSIESRFDDMLIQVDTGILKSHYRGQPAAAIIRGDKVTAYYANKPGDNSIIIQARRVGPRPGGLTDLELENVLATAPIRNIETREDNATVVSVDYQDQPIEAMFSVATSKKSAVTNLPDVAAYRMDRHLGLEMTPVAVRRIVDGKSGAMTLNLDNLIDEDQRMARQLGSSAWCSLKDQFNMMYMFDILLHNKGRGKNSMHYAASDMRLILTANGNTLGAERHAPRYLRSVSISIPAQLKLRLLQMDEQMLEALLGDVLEAKRRKAILSRRDLLLDRSK